ncbi:MAG: tRNA 4-thiouridine(8) synthase ThiI [Candidatus Nealsonbacteria bacterium]|nr:tRNA 4-thiouridine(8) synthase ThiI [Candidatus Nealsonbacteria bacterium]
MDYIICHYHEIALKGKNRKFFEQKLVKNIKMSLPKGSFEGVRRISGRILVKLSDEGKGLREKMEAALKNVFGIVYFAFADTCDQDIESIQKEAAEILRGKNFKSFRVTTKRSKKDFPLTSQEVNEEVGAFIVDKTKKDVDLENFDINIFIEIVEDFSFLYLEEIKGPGGLPVGSSGRVGVLLSGGIDSPVAAYLAMKRGANVFFIHFHAHPYTDKAAIDKAKRLVSVLNRHHFSSKIYLVPFGDIQKKILLEVPADLRIIIYRRLMLRIAQEIARKEDALALVTGENIGQVASQTIENIRAIEGAVEIPILRPLITYDKQEIIKTAKEVGTFETSILPHEDCCVRFLPSHPETKATLKEVEEAEKGLKIGELVEEGTKEAIVSSISKVL